MHIDPCEHECQGFIAGITQAVDHSTEELTSTVTVDTEHPKINTNLLKNSDAWMFSYIQMR